MTPTAAPLPRLRAPSAKLLIVALILAAGAVSAFLLLRDREATDPDPGRAEAVSAEDLREYAAGKDSPVYWAGAPQEGRLELTETRRHHVFVRYLEPGARAGDPRAAFTTIATYPLKSAYAVTVANARRKGRQTRRTADGGIAVWDRRRPTSVYLASPASDVHVEVYDPSPAEARALALSGRVGAVR